MNKKRAALLSVGSNSLLVVVKLAAGIISGSISIISEALHSLMDLVASLIAYFSVRQASLPPDKQHPYGHGKMENLSGLLEAALLILASLFIMYESAGRIRTETAIRMPLIPIVVIGFSAVVNIFVSRYLYRVARATDSIALEADAKHLSADVYTSIGVFVGLILVSATGLTVLDPLIAIVIALYIAYEGIVLSSKSIGGLLDARLPDDEERLIRQVLSRYGEQLKDYHHLRTRKSGSERHIDFHATICRDETISSTHSIMEEIEKELQKVFPRTKVLIHPEPCDHHSENCPAECYWEEKKKEREGKGKIN